MKCKIYQLRPESQERELPGKLHQQQQKFSPSLLLMLLDLGSGRENYLVSFINNNKNLLMLLDLGSGRENYLLASSWPPHRQHSGGGTPCSWPG
jgi:hypothetical protein